MLNKYMKMDPVPWLTDGENPAVTYLVKSELLKLPDEDKLYGELIESNLTDYFRKNSSRSILGDTDHPDLYYRGSVWFYLYAVECGYKNTTDFVNATADFICSKTCLDNGGFRYGYKSSHAVGCRTGNMVYSLLKSGVSDSRTSSGLEWIIKNQRNDGGWLHCPVTGFCDVMKLVFLNSSGNGLKHENDNRVSSCPVASYSCLKALVQAGDNSYNDIITKGADFFIRNNFFIQSKEKVFCGNRVSFKNAGYPVMSQYDYLSGITLISQTGNVGNYKFSELFNHIIKKQNLDGSWDCENNLQGMIKEKKGSSRWVTLNAVKFISNILEKEN
jgi:hypothetical protein